MYAITLTAKSPRELNDFARKEGKHPISYSQYSMYANCPMAWKFKYLDKIQPEEGSIHCLFGSAMHTVIQEYLTVYYNKSAKEADEINFDKRLLEEMKLTFTATTESLPEHNRDFTSQKEMLDFYKQGLEILYYLRNKRAEYFPKKDWELYGIEVPIVIETDTNEKVMFIGFLDIVLRNTKTNRYKIIDLKTSSMGWNDKKRKSEITNNQIILYKKYLAKQLEINPDTIDVEYLILRRIIFEKSEFPQKRIQKHKPASGKPSINKAQKSLDTFLEIFDENGLLKENFEPKKSGGSACKYCHYGSYGMCDKGKVKKNG